MAAGMRAVVAAVALVAAAGCTGTSPPVDRTPENVSPRTEKSAGSGTSGVVLDTDPYDTVRNVYRGVAGNVPDEVCARFTTEAARQFAGHFEAESCTTVVKLVHHGLVADPEAYAGTSLGHFTADDSVTHTEIDSCEFEVLGGPRLGVFVVDRGESGTWMITAHRMERCDRATAG